MSQAMTFSALPKTADALRAMPESALTSPFQTACLTVLALVRYEQSPQDCIDMLNFLKGTQPMSAYETKFLHDRLNGRGYIPRSFFAGASPKNNYQPSVPYCLTLEETPYSYAQEGYVSLYVRSSGADFPRQIKLCTKGKQWFLWEQFLLTDIRRPEERKSL